MPGAKENKMVKFLEMVFQRNVISAETFDRYFFEFLFIVCTACKHAGCLFLLGSPDLPFLFYKQIDVLCSPQPKNCSHIWKLLVLFKVKYKTHHCSSADCYLYLNLPLSNVKSM